MLKPPKVLLHVLLLLILTANLNGKCFCSHSTDGENKAQSEVLDYVEPKSEGLISAGG